jgi:aspartate racemase
MKTIGIIGGIGPQATMYFESRLHTCSQKYIHPKANGGYPPMWVRYLREAPIKLREDGTPVIPREPSRNLLEIARILGTLSDAIVITSNSPHVFINEIEQSAQKPVLNMIEMVVREIKKRGYKKVGVMGISGSIQSGLYEKPLTREGIVNLSMSLEISTKLDPGIFKVMEGQEDEASKDVAREALKTLRDSGCDAIILGCTEIPFLLKEEAHSKDVINPLDILAEETIKYAIA